MSIKETVNHLFGQLEGLVVKIDDEQYTRKLEVLSGSSLGQHVRHILEFFVCLHDGYEKGFVNYDKRERDITIETSRFCALSLIDAMRKEVIRKNQSQGLTLEVSYSLSEESSPAKVSTSYERELIYNIEHAVHHMAIIKIGAKTIHENIELPNSFGVAVSTIKHQSKNVYSHLSSER